MNEKFGLPNTTYTLIAAVFSRHPEIQQVKIFGSRAIGNYKPYSDIDIALWGTLKDGMLTRIKGELEDLPTPYKFDVVDYQSINHQPFKEHIDTYGVDFMKA